jgi:hypothetical protein
VRKIGTSELKGFFLLDGTATLRPETIDAGIGGTGSTDGFTGSWFGQGLWTNPWAASSRWARNRVTAGGLVECRR